MSDTADRVLRNPTFRRSVLAIPAMLIAIGAPMVMFLLKVDLGETRQRYEGNAARAQKEGDTATAGICLDRLTLLRAQTGFNSPDFVLNLAKLALGLGQSERADALLDEIAPDDRAVHAPAHHMRAVLLLRGTEGGERDTRADRVRAERQLRHALELDPKMTAAHEILGLIALQGGDLARAEGHLECAANANPALSYHVAEVMHRQGRSESAAVWASKARDLFSQIIEKDPDNHGARILLASSEVLLENHESARTILLKGLSRVNLREFHQLLAKSYLIEAAALAKVDCPNTSTRMTLLEHALRHDPNNTAVIEQISAVLKEGGTWSGQFRGQLQALLVEGQALTTAHLLLGYDAWEHGRTDEARLHWERAFEANPKSAVVANNLAWALATGPKPDLSRALNLVNLALDRKPTEPTLLGTRGRILVRLERWKEALSSLETALPALPDNRELHTDLATVYAALGSPELAEQHRRLDK